MASLNRVFLIGNLTRDPELRYIPSGTAVATFTVAVNRTYTSQSGEKKEDPCFVRVIVWARLAEVCGEFLSKGSPVFVEGRLQSRNWQDQSGQKRSTIEVVANTIQFLGKPAKAAGGPAGEDSGALPPPEEPMPDVDVPGEVKPAGNNAGHSEEEVPF